MSRATWVLTLTTTFLIIVSASFILVKISFQLADIEELLSQQNQNIVEMPRTEKIAVSGRKFPVAFRFGPDEVKFVDWPSGSIPDGAYKNLEELFPDSTDLRIVSENMWPGEPIIAQKLTEPGTDLGLASRLERGKRAFAVRIAILPAANYLSPGVIIDVYFVPVADSTTLAEFESSAKRVVERIKVIAVDQSVGVLNEGEFYVRTITLSATPEQVMILTQAQTAGVLMISLVEHE